MVFCVNCGRALDDGMRFCPLCGTAVSAEDSYGGATVPITEPPSSYDPAAASDYRVILFSRGTCSAANARALLRDILGYTASEARNILTMAPVEIACNMTMAQAMYLAQALTEYGMSVSVCNTQGYVNVPQTSTTSVYDRTGSFLPAVASALAMLSAANRVREFRRWNYGPRPSLFRLAFRPAPPPRSARRYSSFGIFHPAPRPTPRPVSPRPAPRPVPPHPRTPAPRGSAPKPSGVFGGGAPRRPTQNNANRRQGGSVGRPGDGFRSSGGGRLGGRGNQRF